MNIENLIHKYNLNIRGVIHIGAHFGEEYTEYVNSNIKNMMFFEPLLDNFKILLNNIKLSDNIKAYNIALGNTEGEIDMFVQVINTGGSGSILEPEEHLIRYPDVKFNGKKVVKINKLDNIEYDRNKFNFICIDVQGYELEVLRGATIVLHDIDYIMTEINTVHLYKNGALDTELDHYLLNFGFIRIESDWNGNGYGDALYIKNK